MRTPARKKIADMNPKDVMGSYRTTSVKYFDGSTRRVLCTDLETTFPADKKIMSVTDTDGHITHINSVFMQMSGYSKEELMGVPHHILRHPDMPRAVFNDLWSCLSTKGKWEGIVKNLRKDGGFYWVLASVSSLYRNGKVVGYTSSREAAPTEKVQACIPLYKEMLAQELDFKVDLISENKRRLDLL